MDVDIEVFYTCVHRCSLSWVELGGVRPPNDCWCILSTKLCTFSRSHNDTYLPHAVNCGRFCFWRRQFVVFCFVYKISWEPLNRFVPNSHGRCVWCLARTRLKIKVRGHGHQGQKRHFSALSAACLRFMFGKSYVASTCYLSYCVFAI